MTNVKRLWIFFLFFNNGIYMHLNDYVENDALLLRFSCARVRVYKCETVIIWKRVITILLVHNV